MRSDGFWILEFEPVETTISEVEPVCLTQLSRLVKTGTLEVEPVCLTQLGRLVETAGHGKNHSTTFNNMPKLTNDDSIAATVVALVSIPVVYFSLFVSFERESGDNILHYFFARYAFEDPMLFLDHWAKPVFTLLASPFAQFGFSGMKLFNGLVGITSALMTYLAAKEFRFRFPWLAILFVMFAPTYFTLLFSGFTEPLFGLFLVTGLYLVLKKRYIAAALLFSFLPYVRTEGVFIASVLGGYFLLIKQWRYVPFLLAGSLLYTLAGWMAGKDLLWLFTEMPYGAKSVYGSGSIWFYSEQWILAIGVPLGISSVAGMALLLAGLFSNRFRYLTEGRTELYVLLPAIFLSYFVFHTLSWGLGLFASYGMIRILVPLVPLQGLISLFALQYLLRIRIAGRNAGSALVYMFIAYVLVFPFLSNPASLKLDRDFRQSPDLEMIHQISREIKEEYPGSYLLFSDPYFSYAFGINHFDMNLHMNFTEIADTWIKPGSIVIWDNWSSRNYVRFNYDFDQMPGYRKLKTYNVENKNGERVFKVYRKD